MGLTYCVIKSQVRAGSWGNRELGTTLPSRSSGLVNADTRVLTRTYTCTHLHTCMHTHAQTYTHCTCTPTHAYVHTQAHTYTCVWTHMESLGTDVTMCTHIYNAHVHTYTPLHTYIHTCTHLYTHLHTPTHAYGHTRTYTHASTQEHSPRAGRVQVT